RKECAMLRLAGAEHTVEAGPLGLPGKSGGATRRWDRFRAAFRKVAVHLGRPGSEGVLVSGVPFDENDVTAGDVSRLGHRIGLEVTEHRRGDLRGGNVDPPIIVLFADGSAVALLEGAGDGRFATEDGNPAESRTVTVAEVLGREVRAILSFSVVDTGSVSPGGGRIERRHWLAAAVLRVSRSGLQVALAALCVRIMPLA